MGHRPRLAWWFLEVRTLGRQTEVGTNAVSSRVCANWRWVHRAELQRVFFPPTYQEADRTHRLGPGDHRIWTAMRIFVELRGGTTLHIPFREASKVFHHLHCVPSNCLKLRLELAMGRLRQRATTSYA
jgi:hypothetical protein